MTFHASSRRSMVAPLGAFFMLFAVSVGIPPSAAVAQQDPQAIKPGCLMPAFGLTEAKEDQIVRYLLTLY